VPFWRVRRGPEGKLGEGLQVQRHHPLFNAVDNPLSGISLPEMWTHSVRLLSKHLFLSLAKFIKIRRLCNNALIILVRVAFSKNMFSVQLLASQTICLSRTQRISGVFPRTSFLANVISHISSSVCGALDLIL
jgi:hypothetical protein